MTDYKNIWLACIAACSFVWHTPAGAQDAAIKGVVSDEQTGAALPGANIIIRSSTVKRGTVSDDEGTFTIAGLASDKYTVTASHTGYETRDIEGIVLQEGERRQLEIPLVPTVFSLNPISVSASRSNHRVIEAPAAVTVLTKSELEATPALSPADHVRGVPGVDIIATGLNASRIVVRGFNNGSSGRLLMLTDNRIASIPSLRINVPQLMPATDEDVERVEVVSGPVSAVYGPNAVGGVMHVITRSPFDAPGTTVSVGIGERNVLMTSVRHAGVINPKLGYKISAARHSGKDWKFIDPAEPDSIVKGVPTLEGRIAKTEKIPNTRDFDVEKLSADAQLDFRPADNLKAIISGGFSRISNLDITDFSAFQLVDWTLGHAQARLFYKSLFAQTYVNVSNAGDSYGLINGDILIDRSVFSVSQIQNTSTFWQGRQRLTYGVDLLLTRPRTQNVGHGRNEQMDDVDEIGYFVQSETDLSTRLKLFATARIDDHSRLKKNVFSPRVGLTYKARPNHSFRFTFNRAFDAPIPNLLFLDTVLAPTLGPFPYAIRIRGVPSETGYTFRRDAAEGLGGLYMQSPFNLESAGGRSAFIPADATLAWNGLVGYLQTQGTDISAVPAPTNGDIGTALGMLDANTGGFNSIAPADVIDIDPLKPLRTTTFELGYKGLVGDATLLFANIYHENNRGFSDILLVETPNVFYEPSSLTSYLQNHLSPEEAAAVAELVAGIPVGTVSPQEGDPADILITVRNQGDISIYGLELGFVREISPSWTIESNYAYLSENFFKRTADQPDDRALNAPQHKFAGSVRYIDPTKGISAQLRFRYVDEYPIISGLGRTTLPSYGVVDLNTSYQLPFEPRLNLTLSVQNLLNDKHREYIRTPKIGRLGILRVMFTL